MARTIDFHTHVVPPTLPAAPADEPRWPAIELTADDAADVTIAGKLFRRIDNRSWDAAQRIADMDADGIDIQVLSPMPELLSYWFAPDNGGRFCEAVNTHTQALVAGTPDRFLAIGMAPLQEPGLAAEMVHDLAARGFIGVEIGTHVNGRPLGDPAFDPFWAACRDRQMMVMVHALHPAGLERVGSAPDAAVTAFPVETSFAALSLLLAGVPERFEGLDILLSHGGGALPLLLPRVERAREMGLKHTERLSGFAMHMARAFLMDSIVYDARTLRYIADMMGPHALVMGSDYPFAVMQPDPAGFVRKALGEQASSVLAGSGRIPSSLRRLANSNNQAANP